LKSRTTRTFWHLFGYLPADAQAHAREAYKPFRADPAYPGLHFKRVNRKKPIYSARIGIRLRAVGLLEGDTITWFWIGSHDDYERLLGS
jgi:hypothetical protein